MTNQSYAEGDLVPGTTYRVHKRLAMAGFGAVYEVQDPTGSRYCLKTLHAVTGDIEEFRQRLSREAQTLSRLAHPNIVQILASGLTESPSAPPTPYFVMELLRGRTLRETLDRREKLDIWHALTIASEALDALEHAHGRGVIHRDVKPENIFLHRGSDDVEVHAKLLDFGVVTIAFDGRSSAGDETAHRSVGFSPRYAAPEVLEGSAATAASDLYSMGIVLYEMLTGHGPFEGGDLSEVARARLERPPARLDVHVPIVLEDLILSALERDPSLRPSDAFSFAETLRMLANRTSRIPQGSLLSSAPPQSSLPEISEIPEAIVEAHLRPPRALEASRSGTLRTAPPIDADPISTRPPYDPAASERVNPAMTPGASSALAPDRDRERALEMRPSPRGIAILLGIVALVVVVILLLR